MPRWSRWRSRRERERTQWYFQRYVQHLPAAGEIVLFDRSWYNRAGVERVMGFCSDDGVLTSSCARHRSSSACWSLAAPPVQVLVLGHPRRAAHAGSTIRQVDPVKQWKLSPIDLESLDKWDAYTDAKEAMFHYTDSELAPWTVVKSNDKKRARLEAIKHVLRKFDYDGKDEKAIGEPDQALIGPPSGLSEHNSGLSFPSL